MQEGTAIFPAVIQKNITKYSRHLLCNFTTPSQSRTARAACSFCEKEVTFGGNFPNSVKNGVNNGNPRRFVHDLFKKT